MKLRIRGNSVRVRLTRSEVTGLGSGQRVEQTTRFSATAVLTSSVEPSAAVVAPTARFSAEAISVLLPREQVRAWASSEQVTIDARQECGDGSVLQILVEKDFECIHSRADGNADAFPNPREPRACVQSQT